jgi:hypothetical protein
MTEQIATKKGPLFRGIKKKPMAVPKPNGDGVVPKTTQATNSVSEKVSLFTNKKIIASTIILAIAIIAVIVVLIVGSTIQEEVVQKSSLLIPFMLKRKK